MAPGLVVLFGDVDNDGKADLVATHGFHDNNIVILRGNGSGGYAALSTATVVGEPESAALGDVNGDGNLDIVTANLAGSTVAILIGNGDGTFKAPVTAAVGANPVAIAPADLNGDGRLDIVTANQSPFSPSALPGDGDGTFQPQTTIAVTALRIRLRSRT